MVFLYVFYLIIIYMEINQKSDLHKSNISNDSEDISEPEFVSEYDFVSNDDYDREVLEYVNLKKQQGNKDNLETGFKKGVINFTKKYDLKGGKFERVKKCIGKKEKNTIVEFKFFTDSNTFKFVVDNDNNSFDMIVEEINNQTYAYFLGEGASTLVYSVTLIENNSSKINNQYALKLIFNENNYKEIVKKYLDDKKMMTDFCKDIDKDCIYKNTNPLIDIYAHGKVAFNKKKCDYTPVYFFITKKYLNEEQVYNFNIEQKIYAFNQFVKLLSLINTKKYVIYDLKTANIGYEMKDVIINTVVKSMPVIVFIDYDKKLFRDVNALINHQLHAHELGTFIPYHIMKKIDSDNLDINDLLFNTLGGLCEIFTYFFLNTRKNSALYRHVIKLFDTKLYEQIKNIEKFHKNKINGNTADKNMAILYKECFIMMNKLYENNKQMLFYLMRNFVNIKYFKQYFIDDSEKLDVIYFDNLIISREILLKDMLNDVDFRKQIKEHVDEKDGHFFHFIIKKNDNECIKKIFTNIDIMKQLDITIEPVNLTIDAKYLINKKVDSLEFHAKDKNEEKYINVIFQNDTFYTFFMKNLVDIFLHENDIYRYMFVMFYQIHRPLIKQFISSQIPKQLISSQITKKYLLLK